MACNPKIKEYRNKVPVPSCKVQGKTFNVYLPKIPGPCRQIISVGHVVVFRTEFTNRIAGFPLIYILL